LSSVSQTETPYNLAARFLGHKKGQKVYRSVNTGRPREAPAKDCPENSSDLTSKSHFSDNGHHVFGGRKIPRKTAEIPRHYPE
jgi:hypothetical protein